MRGVFAVLVLAYHYSTWLSLPIGSFVYGALDRTAIYAVCGFFVLSGASMAISYQRSPPTTPRLFLRYLVRRFFRIAPLFYLVLALHVAGRTMRCISAGQCEADFFATLLANLTFTFGIGKAADNSMVIAGWSIGIEWCFYLLFPIMIVIAGKSLRWALALLAACCAILLAWDAWYLALDTLYWPTYAQFPAYLAYFAAGVLIGSYRLVLVPRAGFALAAVAAIYVSAHASLPTFSPDASVAGPTAWIFGALTCIAVAIGTWSEQPTGQAREVNTVAGDISYALYLLHFPAFAAINFIGLTSWAGAATASLLAVISAYGVNRFFELPFTNLGRRISELMDARPVRSSVGPH